MPKTMPTATPPAPMARKLPVALSRARVPVPAAALTATVYTVSAVPSFSMLSPVMIVSSRRGRCRRRPMLAADTASVGARIAPRVSAAASGSPGTARRTAHATTAAVNSTRPTESRVSDRTLSRRFRYELSSAAAYTSGGRTPSRTKVGLSRNSGMPGM